MVDSLYHLISLLFFWYSIIILYYILNLDRQWFSSFNFRSSIILSLSSEGINLSLSISSAFVSEFFFGEVFETFVILSEILFQIKSPVPSAVFWINLFEAVLSAFIAGFLAWSRSFWLYLLLKFLLLFLPIFYPFTNIRSLGWTR